MVEPPAIIEPRRNHGIDALRGVSILLVVVHHLALRIPLGKTALGDYVPKRVTSALGFNGYEAVFVFFVISGFLITTHSLARWGSLDRIDLRGFYVRRLARIAPCLVLLLVVLSLMHLAGVPYYVIDKPNQSWAGATLSALGLYLNWYEAQTDWLPGGWDVLWSLSIEESFYVGFPLVCRVSRDKRVLVAVLSVLALSLPLTRGALEGSPIWQEKAYLPGMSAIATGVLAALLVERWAVPRGSARLLTTAGIFGLIGVFVFGAEVSFALGELYMLLLTGSAALLIVGLHTQNADAEGSRAWAWLRSWGRLSYEIYLTHMFVVFALVAAFRAQGSDMRAGAWWYLPLLAGCWALGRGLAQAWSTPWDHALRRRYLSSPRPS